jgi:integrase
MGDRDVCGLRRGELLALQVEDVNLATGVIHVRRFWDQQEGEIATKTRKDRRVPIATVLRDYLDEHLLQLRWESGLVFGAGQADPFATTSLASRAATAWKRAKLAPITLHECRHTFASLMIAAGVNAKALSTHMGHANIAITMDRYGHLMPGNEGESATLLDAYLTRDATATGANTGARPVLR